MAEGCEEAAENSNSGSGEAIAMLGGTVMPCESSSGPTLGVIKRELESIQANTSNTMTPSSTSSSPTILQQQQHPINLKSEESERDGESTPPASPQHVPQSHMNERLATGLFSASMLSDERQPASEHAKAAAAAAAVAQAHLNGTMQGMLNLQKLQNLATIQHASMPPSLSGLQGLAAGLSSLNSPLNLSVTGGNAPMTASGGTANAGGSGDGSSGSGAIGSAQLPQLILASGQLVQGIQGAQLLIPTSQGIATQTILTIPVSQQVHSNEQLVQHLAALSNGTTALNGPVTPPILNRHLLSNGVQQLLAAVQPALFGATSPHQTMPQAPVTPVTNVSPRRMPSTSPPLHHRSMHTSPKASPPRGAASSHHPFEKLPTTTATSTSQAPHSPLYTGQPSNGLGCAGGGPQMPPGSTAQSQTSLHHTTTSSSRLSPIPAAMNRLSSQNGELTITKSHGPSPSHSSSGSGSNHPSSQHTVPPMKLSPSSMHLSPTGTDNSNADFLADSPNEPTINQATCNVVDGIDLDEIKEFAKAFKLRRLSLGLTQTQVGQALSVTEGPAYSQSAICSALAAQMYAAQFSTQQQAMFEKLDITPKSAQKIKPVLERWMKEAEESHWNRYKSGQNHLTDFIGVEPSKKRKRRTSFTPQALELLNAHFERNTHPSGTEITGLAHQLGYEREVIRIWFCNKRQALKNTVRMMSKGIV